MRLRYPLATDTGVFATNYREDMAIFFTRLSKMRIVLTLALLVAFPFLVDDYPVSIANMMGIAVIGALGLNVLTGFTGQISIGQGAFMGVGAYTAGYLTATMGMSFWIALPLAGLTTALVGGVFGIPSLRLKGLYLAIATLAAQEIILFGIVHWKSVTNGTQGLFLPAPSLFGYSLDDNKSYYFLVMVLAVILTTFAFNIFRTRMGRAMIAIRDRDLAAEVMGIDLFKYKIMSFALSSFYVGVAGALWGHYVRIIDPEQFTIAVSIQYLAMVIIGGLGSVTGAIYGAAFITLMPIALRELADVLGAFLPNIQAIFLGFREAIFGITIVIFLIFEPDGLAKIWSNIKEYFKLWPFSY